MRACLLVGLLDGPAHGYELIQRLEAKTEGAWAPSPGSVYPQLQLLADEGKLAPTERDGKTVFELTDEGRAEATERLETEGEPWANLRGGPGGGLRTAMRDLGAAARQVGATGDADTVAKATEILTAARKDLYRLLAEV